VPPQDVEYRRPDSQGLEMGVKGEEAVFDALILTVGNITSCSTSPGIGEGVSSSRPCAARCRENRPNLRSLELHCKVHEGVSYALILVLEYFTSCYDLCEVS
jgi:hypothetical protein